MKKLILIVMAVVMILSGMVVYGVGGSTDNLFNIGSCKLNADIRKSQLPTVIFESGYGDDHTGWDLVQAKVSKYTTTISYDRAGLGASTDTRKSKTVDNQIDNLYRLLKRSRLNGPYIYVAHSMGALNARLFADKYKGSVVGIILVDGSHEDQEEYLKRSIPPDAWEQYTTLFKAEGNHDNIERSCEIIRNIDDILDIPVVLLTAGNQDGGPDVQKVWMEYQQDLLGISSNSRQIVVDSGHYIHITKPDVVVEAIEDMLFSK